MLGLTSWKVSYAVQASPEQIDTFYQQAARDAGFSDDGVLVGLHTFRQRSTNNDFNYMVWKDPHGQLVMFQARTFGQPATPAAGQ